MKKRNSKNFIIFLFAILAILTPFIALSLINIPSTDTRTDAFDSSSSVKCQIRFLYVDPSKIEINKAVTLEVSTNTPGETSTNLLLYSNEAGAETPINLTGFTPGTEIFSTEFSYTPSNLGKYSIYGTLSTNITNYPCLLAGGAPATAQVVAKNEAPTFISAVPGNEINVLKVGDRYKYDVVINDVDSFSSFGYDYSFTPRAPWLENPTITKEKLGDGGTKLTIRFNGIPDKPASYLANIMAWDGYNGNTVSQAWVISVSQKNNDIPMVTFTALPSNMVYKAGDTIKVSWKVTDLNQIQKYTLYLATSPSDKASWKEISSDIKYNQTSYNYVIPEDLKNGKYYFILEATDNQNPPSTGKGISGNFSVNQTIDNKPIDECKDGVCDGPQVEQSEIIIIYPLDNSEIEEQRPNIQAKLITTDDNEIVDSSIKFYLNDSDLTEFITKTVKSKNELTLSFQPKEDLEDKSENKIKITFEDKNAEKTEKTSVFTVKVADGSEDYVTILGFKIAKRFLVIGAIILLIIIFLAFLIPYLIYSIIKNKNKAEDYDEVNQYDYSSNSVYQPDNYVQPASETEYPQNYSYTENPASVTTPSIQTTDYTLLPESMRDDYKNPPAETVSEVTEEYPAEYAYTASQPEEQSTVQYIDQPTDAPGANMIPEYLTKQENTVTTEEVSSLPDQTAPSIEPISTNYPFTQSGINTTQNEDLVSEYPTEKNYSEEINQADQTEATEPVDNLAVESTSIASSYPSEEFTNSSVTQNDPYTSYYDSLYAQNSTATTVNSSEETTSTAKNSEEPITASSFPIPDIKKTTLSTITDTAPIPIDTASTSTETVPFDNQLVSTATPVSSDDSRSSQQLSQTSTEPELKYPFTTDTTEDVSPITDKQAQYIQSLENQIKEEKKRQEFFVPQNKVPEIVDETPKVESSAIQDETPVSEPYTSENNYSDSFDNSLNNSSDEEQSQQTDASLIPPPTVVEE